MGLLRTISSRQALALISRCAPAVRVSTARRYKSLTSQVHPFHMWLPVGGDTTLLQRAREALQNLDTAITVTGFEKYRRLDAGELNSAIPPTCPKKETEIFIFTSEHIINSFTLASLRSKLPQCVLVSLFGNDALTRKDVKSPAGPDSTDQVGSGTCKSDEHIGNEPLANSASGGTYLTLKPSRTQVTHILIGSAEDIQLAAKFLLRHEYRIAVWVVTSAAALLGNDQRIFVPISNPANKNNPIAVSSMQECKPLGLADLEDMWTDEKPAKTTEATMPRTAQDDKREFETLTDEEIRDTALWNLKNNSRRLMDLLQNP